MDLTERAGPFVAAPPESPMPSDLGLPKDIWNIIFAYLQGSDLRSLMLVGLEIKDIAQSSLYDYCVFTEWADNGYRLAAAIKEGKISELSASYIKVAEIVFTSFKEILPTLRLLVEISGKLQALQKLYIKCCEPEQLELALELLGPAMSQVEFILDSKTACPRIPGSSGIQFQPDVTERIAVLETPVVRSSCIRHMKRIQKFEVTYVARVNDVCEPFPHPPERLSLTYFDWQALGSPSSSDLELNLTPKYERVIVPIHYNGHEPSHVESARYVPAPADSYCIKITNSALENLKLVASVDVPNFQLDLRLPCLRTLILCNISKLVTYELFLTASLLRLEFISLAPANALSLQALCEAKLPNLRLVVIVVNYDSFDNPAWIDAPVLIEWIQSVAKVYPTEVQDYTGLIKRDIFFHQGLWCLSSQTPYRHLMQHIRPPLLGDNALR